MRISDWSSDVCSSDLGLGGRRGQQATGPPTLIERAVLEKRLVVEQQRHLAGCRIDVGRNLSHHEIALDGVAGAADHRRGDRKSVVSGTSVEVAVDLGGRRSLKKNNTQLTPTYN